MKIIAIDFDGTIVEDQFPEIGKLIPQAIDTISHFQACGHKLILWTCRENTPERNYLNEAIAFCANYGLVFDAVNENTPGSPYNLLGKSRKVYADHYIDDKAMFPLWEAYAGGII
jgi:hydroxymethylpyrimidine pyrophosphatase-like HAD family hydrolase